MRTILAVLWLAASLALAGACFRGIIRRYKRISGFPWLLSAGFAAAAVTALFALRALLAL